MRIAEQVAQWLARNGVDQAFSVTGGGAMFLNQAIGGHEDIACTFMHHEQACAMAAEGYARIAAKPALVMLTTGPGAINAFNGVYGAFTDSIPMIVLSGQVKRETCTSFRDVPGLRQLGDQEGPTIAMATHICKYARLITRAEDLITALPEAYRQATSGRPGPVWLDIPLDIQSATDAIDIPDLVAPAPSAGALADGAQSVLARLRQAKRPLILAGTGVRLAGAAEALVAFAERSGIPVATAWTHDLIASNHPLFAGRPGTIGTRPGNFCLQSADFVLVIGSRLNIRQTSYNWDTFAKHAFVAQVDIDPLEMRKPMITPGLAIEADAGRFLAAMEQALDQAAEAALPSYAKWVGWCQDIGQQYDVRNEHRQKDGRKLNPYLMVDRIFQQARPDDIFVCGNASACILPFQISTLQARQRLFSNSGSASMGYDLPAAIGAARAGNQRVICFAGDGSLQMNIQEFQTLKTHGLNVVVVVLNNEGYLSIRQTHENFFGRVIGANPASGVDFPDFSAVAQAYGLQATTIRDADDLARFDEWLAKDGPVVIEIHVDPLQEFEPRIKSRVDEDGKFVTPELDDMFPFFPAEEVQRIRQSALDAVAADR